MDPKRLFRHIFATHWRVDKAFPRQTLISIEEAIRASHRAHVGQVRFAVEGALHIGALMRGFSARDRAIEVFSDLRVWDTEHNNGILIYLLLADRDVEIVVDRGIHARVDSREWEAICQAMEAHFQQGDYRSGVLHGIEQVTVLLQKHFPLQDPRRDDLSSAPAVI
ncbi:TPM domain-containing protein [Burkholderia cepacia]|uniref:TPM domain-containing protein n=1 Tax=Burkholderia cepacia TaxID=292 RepID=UPI001CF121FC|nr:TPM domain-containing protein [Burkholderia cepacia]MCA7992300.1 TPM domain-containing protein [Burkholderia cepacia]